MQHINDTCLIMPFPRLRHNLLYHFLSVATGCLSLVFSLITTISKSSFLFPNLSQGIILYFSHIFLCMKLFPLYGCTCICMMNIFHVSPRGLQKAEMVLYCSYPKPCAYEEMLVEGMSQCLFLNCYSHKYLLFP